MACPLASLALQNSLYVRAVKVRARSPATTYRHIKLHVGDNDDVLWQIVLAATISDSSIQKQIKHSLDVGIIDQVGSVDTCDLVAEVNSISLDKLRTASKTDVVICERTLGLLSAIQSQRDCYVDRSCGVPTRASPLR